MAYQAVFKRYELKYIITEAQKGKILAAMEPYMEPDKYRESTIRNLYYDTDDYILARHSISRPEFKEKLRVRSYSQAGPDDTVFVELKRKFDHVVYKRRVGLPEAEAMKWTAGGTAAAPDCRFAREETVPASAVNVIARTRDSESGLLDPEQRNYAGRQMTDEIDYFLNYYKNLKPAMFLSYDREAYRMRTEKTGDWSAHNEPLQNALLQNANFAKDFRVTFDSNILSRDYDLSLQAGIYGDCILDEGLVLMELKCAGGIPIWMTRVLSEERIYKTSFSKYGTAYRNKFQPIITEAFARRTAAISQGDMAGSLRADRPARMGFHRSSRMEPGF